MVNGTEYLRVITQWRMSSKYRAVRAKDIPKVKRLKNPPRKANLQASLVFCMVRHKNIFTIETILQIWFGHKKIIKNTIDNWEAIERTQQLNGSWRVLWFWQPYWKQGAIPTTVKCNGTCRAQKFRFDRRDYFQIIYHGSECVSSVRLQLHAGADVFWNR